MNKLPLNVVIDLNALAAIKYLKLTDRKSKLSDAPIDKDPISYSNIIYTHSSDGYCFCYYPRHACNEFIRYIMSLTGTTDKDTNDAGNRVILFGDNDIKRASALGAKLLQNALGKESYNKIKSGIKILSAADMLDTLALRDKGYGKYQPDPKIYGGMYGTRKLDLKTIVPNADELGNTIMITPERFYTTRNQEKNLLLINDREVSREIADKTGYLGDLTTGYKTEDNGGASADSMVNPCSDFAAANKLIYTAGIVASACKAYRDNILTGDKRLADILLGLQFAFVTNYSGDSENNNDRFYETDWLHGQRDRRFYDKGLEVLRKFNANLNFYRTDKVAAAGEVDQTAYNTKKQNLNKVEAYKAA